MKKNDMITLKEAREIVKERKEWKKDGCYLFEASTAVLVLSNRITELEDCLQNLYRIMKKEYGGYKKQSIQTIRVFEKARQILEEKVEKE